MKGEVIMGKFKTRRLTREEREAVHRMGWLWSEWLYLRDSDSEDYFIVVHKDHPTRTRRIRRV